MAKKKHSNVPAKPSITDRRPVKILLGILIAAAALRLIALDQVPPGLHVDEAANAWNAYTLLKTGKDQHGVSWPIFYTRAFGENRSPFYLYALMPFQAIGGMNVWTTRLPAALGGVITVALMYFVGMRLFDPWTGLVAAGLLTLNPWHLQTSRYGFEVALVPLFIMLSLAAIAWANLPLDDNDKSPKPLTAALAGGLVGLSCYGYWAVRLFLPLFIVGVILANWTGWWRRLKTRDGVLAIGLFILVFTLTSTPLFWRHFNDQEISKRAQTISWVWAESDTPGEKIAKVLGRYPGHFGLDFLFISGDRETGNAPPSGTGLFHWYELPLMLFGLVTCLRRLRMSRGARVLLVWIALYPVADLLSAHISIHALRSLPGLCGLTLIAALGAVSAGNWLWQQRRRLVPMIGSIAAIVIFILNLRYFHGFFDEFPRRLYFDPIYGADILAAARWVQPRLREADAMFVTGKASHPYIFTLVGLNYEPHQWFSEKRDAIPGPLPDGAYAGQDVYMRFGKVHFMMGDYPRATLDGLVQNHRPDRIIFIVRPGELGLEKQVNPVHEIRAPNGRVVLWIFEITV